MNKYVVYKQDTGEIVKTISSVDLKTIKRNVGKGENYLEFFDSVDMDLECVKKGALVLREEMPIVTSTTKTEHNSRILLIENIPMGTKLICKSLEIHELINDGILELEIDLEGDYLIELFSSIYLKKEVNFEVKF